MVVWKYSSHVIFIYIIIHLYFSVALTENIVQNSKKYLSLSKEEPEEKWLEKALKDIAYYLRNHKFNEWDRRYYKKKPSQATGFYNAFPTPSLKSIHWEVHHNCYKDFIQCIMYLHSVIVTAPFTRTDDIATSLNNNAVILSTRSLQDQNNECKKALLYSEKTGLPFGGPTERFRWRTSASYYMCWYTMKGLPELSILGESCDNFANCLDETFGNRNRDPRSDDKLSFACAMYSFCPDPCCPMKRIHTMNECYNSALNPCYIENMINKDVSSRICGFNRKYNQNLEQMIQNKWNVSCNCQQKGFVWDSQFGMCIDINECTTKQHRCDANSEDCLNLPGTYQCVCKWGYEYDNTMKKCIEKTFLVVPNVDENKLSFMEKITSWIEFIAF